MNVKYQLKADIGAEKALSVGKKYRKACRPRYQVLLRVFTCYLSIKLNARHILIPIEYSIFLRHPKIFF